MDTGLEKDIHACIHKDSDKIADLDLYLKFDPRYPRNLGAHLTTDLLSEVFYGRFFSLPQN
jgi:hypothetical protein